MWVADFNSTLEEAGTLPRALLARLLSEEGRQERTKRARKDNSQSAKTPADPVILSVNEALASSSGTHLPSSAGRGQTLPISKILYRGEADTWLRIEAQCCKDICRRVLHTCSC